MRCVVVVRLNAASVPLGSPNSGVTGCPVPKPEGIHLRRAVAGYLKYVLTLPIAINLVVVFLSIGLYAIKETRWSERPNPKNRKQLKITTVTWYGTLDAFKCV